MKYCSLEVSGLTLKPEHLIVKQPERNSIRLAFPRTLNNRPTITPQAKTATFHCDNPLASLKTVFDLQKMTVGDAPDL